MTDLGFTRDGLTFALDIKDRYKREEPLLVPDAASSDNILIPEHLLNPELSLCGYDDPITLAVIATKDPESPMSLSATARLGPLARKNALIGGMVSVIGEATRHELVADCCKLISNEAFSPEVLSELRHRASHHVFQTREEYRTAMTGNLKQLMNGQMTPGEFLTQFIELARYGNLRLDIYKRLIVKLMRSEGVRPSLKFMILEQLGVFPKVIQLHIVTAVNTGPNTAEFQALRRELKFICDIRSDDAAMAGPQIRAATAPSSDYAGRARSWMH